jgi:predicted glycosyl hydrolase (DUF1957 family)
MRALVFHGNLQYAEIQKSEIEKVIEKAYLPVVGELIEREVPFGLNVTGYTLRLLPKEVLELIGEGVESGLIEVLGTSYTHAILPLLPLDRVEAQVKRDREVKEQLLGVSPKGFWLPELAYDPIIPAILKDNGYDYLFADGEAMLLSKHLNSALNPVKPLYPHLIKAQWKERFRYFNYILGLRELRKAIKLVFGGKVTLKAVKDIEAVPVWVAVNTAVMLGIGRFPLMGPKKAADWIREKEDILLYGTDIEFIGYRDLAGHKMSVEGLIEVLGALDSELCLPSKLKHSGRELYLRTSSWAPDKSLRIWTEDEGNARLNMLSSGIKGELAFLAENSDARGWEPIPERRLDAFMAVYKHWRGEDGKP